METLLDLKVTYPTDKFKRIQAGVEHNPMGYAYAFSHELNFIFREYKGHPVGEESRDLYGPLTLQIIKAMADKLEVDESESDRALWENSLYALRQDLRRQILDEGPVMVLAAICESVRRHIAKDLRRDNVRRMNAERLAAGLERALQSAIERMKEDE